MIDVEFYGDKTDNQPEKEDVAAQLGEMLSVLEEHYQVKPIIYTTYTIYSKYIKGEFDEYPLWIRNVYYPPGGALGAAWAFWQYTDTAVLEGYEGTEKYIDMNVFKGTKEELEMLLVRKDELLPESMENDKYIDIINEFEKEFPEWNKYDLIYLDDDDVPELVADVNGYYVSVFTYDNGVVYTLMDDMVYGSHGCVGYEYLSRQNVVHCFYLEQGIIAHDCYMTVGNDHELNNYYEEDLSIMSYQDKNENGEGF